MYINIGNFNFRNRKFTKFKYWFILGSVHHVYCLLSVHTDARKDSNVIICQSVSDCFAASAFINNVNILEPIHFIFFL